MKTMCVDFDGVLHSYKSGWKGSATIPDPPVPGSIAWLCGLTAEFNVVVCSARASRPWGWFAIRSWLRRAITDHMGQEAWEWGVAHDVWDRIRITSRKPAASVYVDDRAHRFDGVTFPTHQELRTMEPWCSVKGQNA